MRNPRGYEEYYCGQAGGSIPVFAGGVHKGAGLGSILSGLGRSFIPLLKRGGKELLTRGLNTGMKIAGDVLAGKSVKSSFQNRGKEAGRDLFNTTLKRLGAAPPGQPAKKRIKRAVSTHRGQKKKGRRQARVDSDIFD